MPRESLKSFSDASSSIAKSDVAPKPEASRSRTSSSPVPGPLPDAPRLPHVEPDDDVAQLPPGAFAPEDALDEQIADLERWALANVQRERNESARFWILRGSAFVSASLAAAAGPLGFQAATIVLSACAALFIAVDSAWPGASTRQTYRRAVYDLRQLQGMIKLRWDKVRLAYPHTNSPKRIAHALALLDAVQQKREEIGKYLGNAEPSSGLKRAG